MTKMKADLIALIKRLPDDCTYDDIMAEIYFKQNVDEGLKDIDEGNVATHEVAKKRLSKWIK